jgi:phage terminase large subunit
MTVPERVIWYPGIDFGFSVDPTAAVRACLLDKRTLYIDYEAWEVGVPNEGLPALLHKVPEINKWPSRADSARPETIDYLRRNGFPKIRGATKGKGSVEDGIMFLQGLDIVIHPRCVNLAREFGSYAYKIDKRTAAILPEVEDANNHLIDALRYAVEGLHRKGRLLPEEVRQEDNRLRPPRDYRGDDFNAEDSWKIA